jgi:hypothetical protein
MFEGSSDSRKSPNPGTGASLPGAPASTPCAAAGTGQTSSSSGIATAAKKALAK